MIRILFISVLLLLAGQAWGVGSQQEVLGVNSQEMALKVIDEKCLVCHNRQRIDAAVKSRRDMEKILVQMEKKGVALTERERQVMGHFWGKNPLKAEPKDGKAGK
ncbi:MAG TPA: hypothetical protein VIU41_07040 [Geobacteraceae bacterium]